MKLVLICVDYSIKPSLPNQQQENSYQNAKLKNVAPTGFAPDQCIHCGSKDFKLRLFFSLLKSNFYVIYLQ